MVRKRICYRIYNCRPIQIIPRAIRMQQPCRITFHHCLPLPHLRNPRLSIKKIPVSLVTHDFFRTLHQCKDFHIHQLVWGNHTYFPSVLLSCTMCGLCIPHCLRQDQDHLMSFHFKSVSMFQAHIFHNIINYIFSNILFCLR
jgi:hypothetical protein